jgi:hypothetical protein
VIPVEQTTDEPGEGNCFAACIASVLEVRIEDVPNVHLDSPEDWHTVQAWLAQRNLAMIGYDSDDFAPEEVKRDSLRGYSLCGVRYEYPGGGVNHSVVALNGEIAWNPSPLRDTRRHDSITDWIIFRVLDPARP